MQQRIVSLATLLVVGIIALALGWFARAALPLAAQGIGVDGYATLAGPAAPAVVVVAARLTYQGRLTNSSGTPINGPVSAIFRLYDSSNSQIFTSTRTITPTNGLFTVYLGDGTDGNLLDSILSQAASIGVTVGSDPEMTPRQALNTVVGHSKDGPGVVGSSDSDIGVYGYSPSNFGKGVFGFSALSDGVFGISTSGHGVNGQSLAGTGVYGNSSASGLGVFGASTTGTGVKGFSSSANGVVGTTHDYNHAGLVAEGAGPSGFALAIASGGITVTGASGIGSNTFAFVHESTGGIGGNITGTMTHIDNVLTNGDPNAMLFVTHVKNPTSLITPTSFNRAFGVLYDTGSAKWTIYAEDGAGFPAGVTFNIMVIKR